MAGVYPISQQSRYCRGVLSLTANQSALLTSASWVDENGAALSAAPTGLRGWVLKVQSGAVGFSPKTGDSDPFVPSSGALDDSEASDMTGLYAIETAGSTAKVVILARRGGVS